jgi:hypothetical protein
MGALKLKSAVIITILLLKTSVAALFGTKSVRDFMILFCWSLVMLIKVNRITSDDDATISVITVDGEFVCFGLEDEAGKYSVGVRVRGGFHKRYKRKFGGFHKGMLHVKDVPNFEYILIHIGNTDEDTAGCLLVGKGADTTGELRVNNSTGAYKELYSYVIDAALSGELSIIYEDNDI